MKDSKDGNWVMQIAHAMEYHGNTLYRQSRYVGKLPRIGTGSGEILTQSEFKVGIG
jgi:hypothetical protein